MEATINPAIEPIVREFKTALQAMYGDRLREVILYGSYARGDYDEESDIDLMVVLSDEKVNTIGEVWKMGDLTTGLLFDYGKVISVLPVAASRFTTSYMPVYQNARREGIML